jgi:hypothetical protein
VTATVREMVFLCVACSSRWVLNSWGVGNLCFLVIQIEYLLGNYQDRKL